VRNIPLGKYVNRHPRGAECEIEAEVDQLAAQLWGLTGSELQDMQASLEELK
jgi:hypothetical protein